MKTKYLALLFLVSLLLNAFLGGMIVSGQLSGSRDPMPFMKDKGGPPPMEMMVLRKVEDQKEKLSPDGQKQLDVLLAKYRPLLDNKDKDSVPKLFGEIQKVMTADKFDKEKLVALHKQINGADLKGRETIGHMMVDIASSLSDKDRIAFFNEFMPGPPHKFGKDGRGDKGKDQPPHGEPPEADDDL